MKPDSDESPVFLLEGKTKPASEIVAAMLDADGPDDLAALGSEAELCKALNLVYAPFVLEADTYETLFAAVTAIHRSLPGLKTYPFVSRSAKAVYALTRLDGRDRNLQLGFTDEMYEDRERSRQWYRSVAQIVHPDKIGGDREPMQLLKDLYEMMTHEPAPEE